MHDFRADLEALSAALGTNQRLLGVDLGTKTIGLALSDVELRIASALKTVIRRKFTADAAEITEICKEFGVGGLVVGLPLNMNGTEGPRAQATRAFVRNLGPVLPLPVAFADERLSTVAAGRAMLDADLSRSKRAERIDAAAAAFILQGALDRLRNIRT